MVKNDYRQTSVAEGGTHGAPTFGADLHPDSIKSQHLTLVGGDTDQSTQAVGTVLDREGVSDFVVAHRLHQLDLAELHAVQTYLNHQRNVQDRPRLFAWLATHGFGAQLLRGARRQRQRQRTGTTPAARDPLRYVTGPLSPLIQGHTPDDSPQDQPPAPPPVREQPGPPLAPPPPELWSTVLAKLHDACPVAEWTTWLEPTALLELTDTTVVVGAPNVFARDTVRDHYVSLLEATVQACLGQGRTVEVVISSPGFIGLC